MGDERFPWMNDDQAECYRMLCDMMGGAHHVRAPVRPSAPKGIYCNLYPGGMATHDGNLLTKAVFMAHDRAIRLEISGEGGPGRVRLYLHKRKRVGRTTERHPTIEEALAEYRKRNPAPAGEENGA